MKNLILLLKHMVRALRGESSESLPETGSPAPVLKREWYVTPRAEWLVWSSPASGEIEAFQVILTGDEVFLEWRRNRGLKAGRMDGGERPGRHKQTPMLRLVSQDLDQVVSRVAALLPDAPVPAPWRAAIGRNLCLRAVA